MLKCSLDGTNREGKVVHTRKMQYSIIRSLGSRLQSTAGKLNSKSIIIEERKECVGLG